MQVKVLKIIYSTKGKDGLFYSGFRGSASGAIAEFKLCTENEIKVGDMYPLELLDRFEKRG